MILYHLEMDFYFGLVVGVSGREKMGGLGQAMLWEQRVCPFSSLLCTQNGLWFQK